jgi:hypothetical protein
VTTLKIRSLLFVTAYCVLASVVCAQIGTPASSNSTGSYADLYKRQLKKTYNTGMSARKYTVEKQFAHNPNLSPYLNLSRPGATMTTRYHAYVQPEQARRQGAKNRYNNQAQPGRPAGTQPGRPPGATSRGNPYYSKYYTGR